MRVMVLFLVIILLNTSLAIALSEQQSSRLGEVIDLVKDDKQKFQQVMELLNKKKTDLRGDAANLEKIRQLAAKHSVNLDNYPDIRGLKIEFLPYILSGGGILLILIGFELYRHTHKKTHEEEMHELAVSHQVQQPSQELYNLQQYVRSCIERGYPKESIRKVLLDQGWDDPTIIQMLNSF